MKSIESFNVDTKKEDIEEKDELITRYQVKNNDLKNPLIMQNNDNRNRKKKNHLIFYVFIFGLFLLVGSFISFIIILIIKQITYKEYYEPYSKPSISNHNYTQIIFENGLELLIVKIDENDTAGGSIAFETGYLDRNYEPGYLKLAMLCLLNDNITKNNILRDYLGDFQFSVDEFYSTFSFKILNAGFFKYLKKFSEITIPINDDKIKERINNSIEILDKSTKSEEKIFQKRENHLLQYLLYGYYDEKNNEDILPQGNNATLNNVSVEDIKNIIDIILHYPSKIKIVLSSHFKTSKVKKTFLNYFKGLINVNGKKAINEEKKEILSVYESKFIKQKMIYYNISNYEKNFIKINYYIDGKNESLTDLYLNSGYFNYLKYILNETNGKSLHYTLREKYNITSLSCDFEVILKSKIKFSLNIYLNNYTYNNLDDIIYNVYEYIYNITKYINSTVDVDSRALELNKIALQNFTFTEDDHDSFLVNKKRALELFYKNDKDKYLRDMWLPGKFSEFFDSMKEFTNQLTPNNSVIILGINDDTLKEINESLQSQNISELFKEENINQTKYFSINYSCLDLNIDFEKNYINNESYTISEYNNSYISNFTSNKDLAYDIDDIDRKYDEAPNFIKKSEDGFIEFYFKKDTTFRMPKVYITLYLFHPYLRANGTQNDDDYFVDNKFFEIILYITYIKRVINFNLKDAIRAGNVITISFNQNLIYIDIFAFSDVAQKILDNIKEIIQSNGMMEEINNNFEIYRELALKEFLNPNSNNLLDKLKYYFYQFLTKQPNLPSIYNYHNFSYEEFMTRGKDDILTKSFENINSFIVQGFIYGYYTEEEANALYNNFNISNIVTFKINLENANFKNESFNASDFISWIKTKNDLKNNEEAPVKCNGDSTKIYRYMSLFKYDPFNSTYSDIFSLILKNDEEKEIKGNIIKQQQIFAQFTLNNETKNNFGTIINNILENDIYIESIDVIGDRFYYILHSVIENLILERNNMKESAILSLDSIFYESQEFDESYEKEMSSMDYSKFKNIIKKYIGEAKYVDFLCNSTD